MTTRASKEREPAAATRKGNKLGLSKKTLADLTPGRTKSGAVRGGARKTVACTATCTCSVAC